jgi:hypothetical protein
LLHQLILVNVIVVRKHLNNVIVNMQIKKLVQRKDVTKELKNVHFVLKDQLLPFIKILNLIKSFMIIIVMNVIALVCSVLENNQIIVYYVVLILKINGYMKINA